MLKINLDKILLGGEFKFMENYRKVEIKENDQWTEIDFWKIKKGDIFRLFEPSEDPVVYKDEVEFIAKSDSYLKDNLWQVDTD